MTALHPGDGPLEGHVSLKVSSLLPHKRGGQGGHWNVLPHGYASSETSHPRAQSRLRGRPEREWPSLLLIQVEYS